jgi:hypothetical protein
LEGRENSGSKLAKRRKSDCRLDKAFKFIISFFKVRYRMNPKSNLEEEKNEKN